MERQIMFPKKLSERTKVKLNFLNPERWEAVVKFLFN